MIRRLLWVGALCAALAPPGRAADAALDQASYVRVGASLLRVEVPRADGGLSFGSAVAVAPDLAVTNCHVTRDANAIFVIRHGLRWSVDAQASDVARDLCLLRVPGMQATAVALGSAAALQVGQSLSALGFTGGIGLQNSPGEVVRLHRHDGGEVIQVTNFFNSGASGGGLFDREGRLVGVLTFRLRGGRMHYFAAPVEWVAQLLAEPPRVALGPVRPQLRDQQPYWMIQGASQPRFLQAAALLQGRRWSELEALAADWSRSDPDDAEPWQVLGTALQEQGRGDAAREAFACAKRLDRRPATAAPAASPASGVPGDPAAEYPCRPPARKNA